MTDARTFEDAFRRVFDDEHSSLYRYLDRLTGDAALAADIAQGAFIRLYERGAMPDQTRAWLISVSHNLLRDDRRSASRRRRLLERWPEEAPMGGATRRADVEVETDELRRSVRVALDAMPARDRRLLLLRHEGCSYRELAAALDIAETSVGVLLMRAHDRFARQYTGGRTCT